MQWASERLAHFWKVVFDFWRFKKQTELQLLTPPRKFVLFQGARGETMSVTLGITHLVCDFPIILRIQDSCRPCSNTPLGKTCDILDRLWPISKWPYRKVTAFLHVGVDQYWNVPSLTQGWEKWWERSVTIAVSQGCSLCWSAPDVSQKICLVCEI